MILLLLLTVLRHTRTTPNSVWRRPTRCEASSDPDGGRPIRGCSKGIAQKIIQGGGNYMLTAAPGGEHARKLCGESSRKTWLKVSCEGVPHCNDGCFANHVSLARPNPAISSKPSAQARTVTVAIERISTSGYFSVRGTRKSSMSR